HFNRAQVVERQTRWLEGPVPFLGV
ncbi:uncharacterized protein METZ01_LOCUS338277, partial [marine metagenome]